MRSNLMAKDLYDMTDEEAEAAFTEAKEEAEVEIEGNEEEPAEQPDSTEPTASEESTPEDEEVIEEVEESTDEDEDEDEINDVEEDEEEEVSNDQPETKSETKKFDFDGFDKDEVLPFKVKADKQELDVTFNELVRMAEQGMNYTRKTQEIAPMRKTINTLKENDISNEDIALLIESKQGNKSAIAKLMKFGGVDALDVDTDDEQVDSYKPKEYGNNFDPVMEEVRFEINNDTEFLPATQQALQDMPSDLYEEVASNPSNLRGLHLDVKSGLYGATIGEVTKAKALGDVRDTLTIYKEKARSIVERVTANNNMEVANKNVDTINQKKDIAQKRKNATISKRKAPKAAPEKTAESMSEEEFDSWYKNKMGRSIDDF